MSAIAFLLYFPSYSYSEKPRVTAIQQDTSASGHRTAARRCVRDSAAPLQSDRSSLCTRYLQFLWRLSHRHLVGLHTSPAPLRFLSWPGHHHSIDHAHFSSPQLTDLQYCTPSETSERIPGQRPS